MVERNGVRLVKNCRVCPDRLGVWMLVSLLHHGGSEKSILAHNSNIFRAGWISSIVILRIEVEISSALTERSTIFKVVNFLEWLLQVSKRIIVILIHINRLSIQLFMILAPISVVIQDDSPLTVPCLILAATYLQLRRRSEFKRFGFKIALRSCHIFILFNRNWFFRNSCFWFHQMLKRCLRINLSCDLLPYLANRSKIIVFGFVIFPRHLSIHRIFLFFLLSDLSWLEQSFLLIFLPLVDDILVSLHFFDFRLFLRILFWLLLVTLRYNVLALLLWSEASQFHSAFDQNCIRISNRWVFTHLNGHVSSESWVVFHKFNKFEILIVCDLT